uniref:Uncharacterized protein n=1 Tax=Anopheles dirus TaxID=7168 RepID=A0A182NX83_9DIPT
NELTHTRRRASLSFVKGLLPGASYGPCEPGRENLRKISARCSQCATYFRVYVCVSAAIDTVLDGSGQVNANCSQKIIISTKK